jgi:hypothetical protein
VNYLGDEYRVDGLVIESGRLILFILAAGAWTFLLLMLCLEAG